MSAITEVRTVNIVEARKYITRAFKKKRPVFLWGRSEKAAPPVRAAARSAASW